MKLLKHTTFYNRHGEEIPAKKKLENVLLVAVFIWFFAVAGGLIWYLTEPEDIFPSSPAFLRNNKIIPAVDNDENGLKTEETKKIVVLPGIDKFTGSPNFTKNVKKFDTELKKAATKYGVDCTYLKAYMLAESRGDSKAASAVGAKGLMQLMPLTAKAMGYTSNLFDPLVSVMAGAKYIKHLETTCCHEKPRNAVCDPKQDIKFAIAAYNGGSRCNKPSLLKVCAGQTNWQCLEYDGYNQTRHYVNKVKANYNHLKKNNWGC